MKRVLAVSALGAMFATSAYAADLGRRVVAPPPVVPLAYNWTGFYFGGHLGAGWGDHDGSAVAISGTGTLASSGVIGSDRDAGFLGGVQGGYNFALAPNWVLGIEGDFTWTSLSTTQSASLLTPGGVAIPGSAVTFSRDLNWLASVRGRLGYTWDRWMIYGTGGAAWADYDGTAFASLGNGAVAGGGLSNTRGGWVAGGGVEWAMPSFVVGGDWTARVEYLHYEFDSNSPSASFVPGPGTATFSFGEPSVDVIRVGLNYKFGPRF